MRFTYAESMCDVSHYAPLAIAADQAGYSAFTIPDSICYPEHSDSKYPYTPDGNREFLDGKPFIEPFTLIPALGAVTELPRAVAAGNLAIVSEHAHTFALAAALGFTVNLASFLVIKRTNSIMLKLLGTARNAGLVLFSATFLGEQITQTQARTARASMHK